ncbi:MAG: helix-turn-helix domain-containing protein [Thermoplasmata archaeon]|nr:MAG: helix-turn-helix domain-containing protein [Thermoplasmata archaeon]
MADISLDELLYALENPTRRRILEKLASETHYPLQLSKELNVSQQAIMKHLKVLEDVNLVESYEEKSDIGGPPRKSYVSTKSISIKIDIGPNTFDIDLNSFEETSIEKTYKKLEKQFNSISNISNEKNKLYNITNFLNEINQELGELDHRRSQLLFLRQQALRDANQLIMDLCNDYLERRVLYYVIKSNDYSLTAISETLDMREKVVEQLVSNMLKRKIILDFNDG